MSEGAAAELTAEIQTQSHAAPSARSGPAPWLLAAVALIVGVWLLYAPTLRYEFVYDDLHLVVANAVVRMPPQQWWRVFVPGPGGGGYRPLRNLSYAIDYRLGGMHPAVFRRTNILLHIFATLVVLALARALGLGWLGSVAASAIFAVHPVQTESVTYVSGRRDVLCGALFLFSVFAYIRGRAVRAWGWYATAAVSAVAALMAKEMAITLPLVWLLHDWTQGRESRPSRRSVAVAAVSSGVAALVLVLVYRSIILRHLRDVPWHGGSMQANFATVVRIWVHYVALLVFPKTLIADYSGLFFVPSSGFAEWRVMTGVAAILSWIALGIWLRGRDRAASFGLLWVPLTLLPVSHLLPHGELLAEHYLYIPLVGLCLLTGEIARALGTGSRMRGAVVGCLALSVVGALAWRTNVRNQDWRDSLTFYTTLGDQNRLSPRVYLGLGVEAVKQNQPRAAVREFTQGLRIAPDSPWLFLNRGAAYQQLGQLQPAEKDYRRAIDLGLRVPTVYTNLGLLYASSDRPREAHRALRYARRLTPPAQRRSVFTNMGIVARQEGNYDHALRLFRRALQLGSTSPEIEAEIHRTERMRSGQTPPAPPGQT